MFFKLRTGSFDTWHFLSLHNFVKIKYLFQKYLFSTDNFLKFSLSRVSFGVFISRMKGIGEIGIIVFYCMTPLPGILEKNTFWALPFFTQGPNKQISYVK